MSRRTWTRKSREGILTYMDSKLMIFLYSSWYPPGHGDFYDTFRNSGLLKKFIAEGREYCFLSNIDNLGATVDLNILNKLVGEERAATPVEFVMEVTDKTRADVKVGPKSLCAFLLLIFAFFYRVVRSFKWRTSCACWKLLKCRQSMWTTSSL